MQSHEQLAVRDITGSLKQLMANLGGESGPEWHDALKVFLNKENPWPKRAKDYPTWKIIQLGVCETYDQYVERLRSNGISVLLDCDVLPGDTDFGRRRQVRLSSVELREFGFKTSCRYSEMVAKVLSLGFRLLSVEMAMVARLEYQEQPVGEALHIPLWTKLGDTGQVNSIRLVHHEPDSEEKKPKKDLEIRTMSGYLHHNDWYPQNKILLVRPFTVLG